MFYQRPAVIHTQGLVLALSPVARPTQVLWKVLLVHRFAGHPLDSFIDLLFLANTSAVVMDERHSGYYLHGRNQMHHSGEGGEGRLRGAWGTVKLPDSRSSPPACRGVPASCQVC